MAHPEPFASQDTLEARSILAAAVGQDLAAAGFTVAVRFGAESVAPFTKDDADRVDRNGGCEIYFDRREDGGVRVYVAWQLSRSLDDLTVLAARSAGPPRTLRAPARGTREAWTPTAAMDYAATVPRVMAPALARILSAAGYEVDHDPDDDYDPDLLSVARANTGPFSGSRPGRSWP